jgi:hypothetical protein
MSYIGQGLPADTFQGFVTDSFTGDGSATTFTLSKEPFSEDTLIVVINNVIQKPTTNFTVSGTTLTIVGSAVASGDVIYAIHMGGPLPIGGAAELDLNGASDKLILDADADTTISADTDDQIDFKAGGTDIFQLTATTATFNDNVSINIDDNTDGLTITSTDADATNGPGLRLFRNSASPADSDDIGRIIFSGENDASEQINYGIIRGDLLDVTDGTEDGVIKFETIFAGSNFEMVRMGNGEGVVVNEDGEASVDFRVESDSDNHFFIIDSSANRAGIGDKGSAPGAVLDIRHNVADIIQYIQNAHSSAPYGLQISFSGASPDNNTRYFLNLTDSTTTRLRIYSDGDIQNHDGTYGTISDERVKQDITDANSQWDDFKQFRFVNYKRKDDVRQYGDKAPKLLSLIAQEAEKISPGLIKESAPSGGDILSDPVFGTVYEDGDELPDYKKVGDVKEEKENVKSLKQSILYMKGMKALQEAMARIETLETKVKALEDA